MSSSSDLIDEITSLSQQVSKLCQDEQSAETQLDIIDDVLNKRFELLQQLHQDRSIPKEEKQKLAEELISIDQANIELLEGKKKGIGGMILKRNENKAAIASYMKFSKP